MTSRFVAALVLVLATVVPAFAWEGRIVTTDGRPIAGATMSILGRAGEAITDADGRFVWRPDPTPPFEILVIQSDGTYMKPVTVESLGDGPVTITVESLLSEAVTVSGSAPGIESTPGAGTTTLSGREVDVRQPANLMQAIENVAGVSQVSEGQAAVPAVRGLARGRTLILIDGARVTSERRAGPSATYLDPSIVEGVDVARGPGSVAYGSDAFGGVISVRTRRVTPGTPLEVRFAGTAGTGIPDRRLTGQVSKGLPAGSVLFAAHTRQADDWDSPEGEVFNSGFSDHGFLGRVEQQVGTGMISVGWQSDFGRDIERPRNNSRIIRFYYPYENSHRFTGSYEVPDVAGFKRTHVTTFFGTYDQRTDQDRFATADHGPHHRSRRYRGQGLRRARLWRATAGAGPRRDGRGPERPLRARGPGRLHYLQPGRRRRHHAVERLHRECAPHRHRALRQHRHRADVRVVTGSGRTRRLRGNHQLRRILRGSLDRQLAAVQATPP